MIRHTVSSRAISSIGYDENSMQMEIVFTSSGRAYTFCGVPLQVFQSFLNASSKGSFYHQNIKDRYQC
ncbi:KTSC domain-containing protein [Maridesulfovibrio sp.]|uniref:KTSC domain-containing protein n=1 Tax=Maridesulfovibrio sp. TaxID=2795000 RepID=UPI0039EFA5D1